MERLWMWVGFNVFILALLALDLGIFHRSAHEVRVREAAIWSGIWILLSLSFNLGIYQVLGPEPALEFLTGYLIEYALSVDNIFVFVLIFAYFKVPPRLQHRVLFWGILGAFIMRGAMIGMGAFLIARFHWILYVFGAFLVVTGFRMAFHDETDIEPESNPVMRAMRRFLPISNVYQGQRFFVREPHGPQGRIRRVATPLFVVLVLVETTDLLFAVDSIPAVFAITTKPFIVYTSNVFAILGLRSLYFLLAGVIDRFHYLKIGLAIVLVFVGVKMLLAAFFEIPIALSLGFVALVLASAIGLSLAFPKEAQEHTPVIHDPRDPNGPDAPPPQPPGRAL